MAAVRARTVLLTGSNRGIGLELVKQLLGAPRPPAWIFATCRDPEGPRAQVSPGEAGGGGAREHPWVQADAMTYALGSLHRCENSIAVADLVFAPCPARHESPRKVPRRFGR